MAMKILSQPKKEESDTIKCQLKINNNDLLCYLYVIFRL